ncbi:uncharacterized protein LOC116158778 isoform X1 [Photinus pyralis]|uniref:uncharacterized protein LOC116158585 isoform X1 n=2 Tax=Photinus pyralis TaxID=7054 RepID=UPI0012675B53|nr:uncharacterized protein LOC116158585 isoform X1 [Photinus pyralis]XP_031327249.1 uncharacterized protein LOC116158585 isoform X1 [Photinus pyralis]XP_031327250.1 uncharacterized protein LOC116158585 isoform X1 [Photinus pyralis]XP_031327475.1 uncharacterized protein LOC116158778 isoform X1 [Photinus pyralis]XP_031327476.1 uncharacterized protein LOC116158778 isoform X1 [Photinus pyralis]XP_031327477.1 uncharacterized protein LOC116158778 isoform X1 [Photinus pyralis]
MHDTNALVKKRHFPLQSDFYHFHLFFLTDIFLCIYLCIKSMPHNGNLTWSVIKFPEENSVSVVPTSWLHGNICFWPPYNRKLLQDAIEKGDPPDKEVWQQFQFLPLRNNIFDNFKEAERKSRKATITSDLDSQMEDHPEHITSKRKRKIRKMSSSDNDSSGDDEDMRRKLPKPPQPNLHKQSVFSQHSSNQVLQTFTDSEEFGNNDITDAVNTSFPEGFRDVRPLSSNSNNNGYSTTITSKSTQVDKNNVGDITEYLKMILRKQNILQCMVADMNTKLQNIENSIQSNKQADDKNESDYDSSLFVLIENLPINSNETLKEVEDFLSDEKKLNDAKLPFPCLGKLKKRLKMTWRSGYANALKNLEKIIESIMFIYFIYIIK